MKRFLASAGLAAGILASQAVMAQSPAAERVSWQQSPIIFLPATVTGGEGIMFEGQVLVTFPLRWIFSTRLAQTVTLQHDGVTAMIEAQSLLPKVQVSLPGGAKRYGFCTRSRVAERREGSGFVGLMFGSMLNGAMDKQTCLEDSDADGTLDRAFVLGDGDSIVELGVIEPVAFEELVAEPMGTDDDIARITLLGVGRRQLQLGFDIIQRGEARVFSQMESGRFRANSVNSYRYADNGTVGFSLMGVRFDMDAFDRAGNNATIRWRPEAKLEDFVAIPDNVQTRMIW